MLFFATTSATLIFVLRYNLSVSIVAMVSPIELPIENNNLSIIVDTSSLLQKESALMFASLSLPTSIALSALSELPSNQTDVKSASIRTFDWDENTQGQILSSYFYGYLSFQVLGGRLCERFGAKWILAAGVAVPGILTFLTPLAAFLGPIWLMVNRVLIGSFHATVLSACYSFISVWMPKEEKGRAIIWINLGFEMGGFITLMATGFISQNPNLGWEYAFYLTAIVPFIWLLPYIFLVYSDPEIHPRITSYEKKLIENSKVTARSKEEFSQRVKRVPPKLRWKTVLTSRAVWANVSAKITTYFGYYLLATKMPAYLAEVYDVSLANNGIFCALTYLGTISSKTMCLKLSPWLESKRWMSITAQRKMFQCTSMFIAGSCLALLTVINGNVTVAIGLIVLSMFGLGMTCAGEAANLADFAQDLSGTIFGFANTFTCFDGILTPIITGKIQFKQFFFFW